jgi:AcrR family transcriptional regulator
LAKARPTEQTGENRALNGRATTAPHTLTRREAGKAERRRQIIQAARDLIRETGNAGLSMRGLAARAGVSLATPYNLFGSKRAIVVAVLQDVREFQERFSTLRVADPVEKIFAALDMSIDFYVGDPSFYRTVWAAVLDVSDGVRGEILNPKRDAFWRGLVEEAARAGAIAEDVDPGLLLRQLEAILHSVMFDWVVGEIAPARLGPMATHGYGLVLLGAAAPEWRGPLKARVLEAQAALAECA